MQQFLKVSVSPGRAKNAIKREFLGVWGQILEHFRAKAYTDEDGLCSNLKSLVGKIFETNAKMVLINDDQCDIADIVLDVWLFEKNIESP